MMNFKQFLREDFFSCDIIKLAIKGKANLLFCEKIAGPVIDLERYMRTFVNNREMDELLAGYTGFSSKIPDHLIERRFILLARNNKLDYILVTISEVLHNDIVVAVDQTIDNRLPPYRIMPMYKNLELDAGNWSIPGVYTSKFGLEQDTLRPGTLQRIIDNGVDLKRMLCLSNEMLDKLLSF